MANAANNLRYGPDPTLGIVYLDSWQSQELRVATMRNALENGLKEQRERKNKSKVTQELVERRVKKKRYTRNTSKKRRESLTQMKKEEKIAR